MTFQKESFLEHLLLHIGASFVVVQMLSRVWLFRPHGLQHTRLPCASPSPRICLNSWPLSWWCHPIISSCHPLLLLPSMFPSIRVFSNKSPLCSRWPKYWSFSFSISPSSEYSGSISSRINCLISLLSKELSRVFSSTTIQKHQFFNAQPSLWSTLTSIQDYWKKPELGLYRPLSAK